MKRLLLTGATLGLLLSLGRTTSAQPAQIQRIQQRNEDYLLQLPGVRGIGIGMDRGRWVFTVLTSREARQARVVPRVIEGVPVKFIETDEIVAYDGPPGTNHRAQQTPPVTGGISTSNALGCFAGTRGFLACKADDPTQVGYITNNHVAVAGGPDLCPNSAPIGTEQFHRATLDNGCTLATQIGILDSFVPLALDGVTHNSVDAAFVLSSRNLVDDDILDIGAPTTTPASPRLFMHVRKSGRTTGDTGGFILAVHVTVTVSYGEGCGRGRFTGQFLVFPGTFSSPGDSGSPVVHTATKNPVGLLFAGSPVVTICSPIKPVLSALELTLNCSP